MDSLMTRARAAAADRADACGDRLEAMLSGFDVEISELYEAAAENAKKAIRALEASGTPLDLSFAGVWAAGFLTAMHYERLKRECVCDVCGAPANPLYGQVGDVFACGYECAQIVLGRAA